MEPPLPMLVATIAEAPLPGSEAVVRNMRE